MECSKFTQPDTKWFSHLKRVRPPTAPLQGRSIFSPFRPRRGEKGRWRSAFPHSSAARQTKQPETRPAAESPSVAAQFPSSISARSTSSCGDGRNHQIKNHATIFGASKSIGGSNSNPWSKSNFGRFTTHLQCF